MKKTILYILLVIFFVQSCISNHPNSLTKHDEYKVNSDSIIAFIRKAFVKYPDNLPYRQNSPITNYYKKIDTTEKQLFFIFGDSVPICKEPKNDKTVFEKLNFGDKVYLPKFDNSELISIDYFFIAFNTGELRVDQYYLCITKDSQIGYINYLDYINRYSINRFSNNRYSIFNGRFKTGILSNDYHRKYIHYSNNKSFSKDTLQIVFSNDSGFYQKNGKVVLFDIVSWKEKSICEGYSANFIRNDSSIIYWNYNFHGDSVSESVRTIDLSTGNTKTIFNIPYDYTLMAQADDGISPYLIKPLNDNTIILYMYKKLGQHEVNLDTEEQILIDLKGKVLNKDFIKQ